jgi:hypothetical protein
MVGTRLSRYHILEQIGGGGMGVVYRPRFDAVRKDPRFEALRVKVGLRA